MNTPLRWLAGRQQLGVKPGDLADHIGPLLPAWWLLAGGRGRPPARWGYLGDARGVDQFRHDLETYRAEHRMAAARYQAIARMTAVAQQHREDETP